MREEACRSCGKRLLDELDDRVDGAKVEGRCSSEVSALVEIGGIEGCERFACFAFCEECYGIGLFSGLSCEEVVELHYQFALEYTRRERYSEVVDACHAALRLQPSANLLATAAQAYEALGDRELAIALYRQALEMEPGHFMARENIKALEE